MTTMKITLSTNQVAEELIQDFNANLSWEIAIAIAENLKKIEEETGVEIELDFKAICRHFLRFDSLAEWKNDSANTNNRTMKNKTAAQIFKETMDKRQPLETVVCVNLWNSPENLPTKDGWYLGSFDGAMRCVGFDNGKFDFWGTPSDQRPENLTLWTELPSKPQQTQITKL